MTSTPAAGPPRTPLHQARVAEVLAAELRERIVSGDLDDRVLTQEEILGEFDVSRPSLREALRILETEGLVTVRRGSTGGAVVQAPGVESVAWRFGLVLEAERVRAVDFASAVGGIEAACAALCARRADRSRTVVPRLRVALAGAHAVVDDPVRFTAALRGWHDAIVGLCGNETMRLVAGAVSALWTWHSTRWAASAHADATYPERELRENALRIHGRITDAVERGDPSTASSLLAAHFAASVPYVVPDDSQTIAVTPRGAGWRAERREERRAGRAPGGPPRVPVPAPGPVPAGAPSPEERP